MNQVTLSSPTIPTDRPVVFVVDDDASVRKALEDLLESAGLSVNSFGSVPEFLSCTLPDEPACLVLDVRMPGMSGLDCQREMANSNIHIPIVFITAHGDVATSVRAMKAGAIEFLSKPFRDQDLLGAIHDGIERDRARRRSAIAMEDLRQRFSELTEGERKVMKLVVTGLLNKQIAAELGLSEITVKVRRGSLMRKMQARSLADLVRMADKLAASAAGDEH
jgi:FixJ family two-component response regulator